MVHGMVIAFQQGRKVGGKRRRRRFYQPEASQIDFLSAAMQYALLLSSPAALRCAHRPVAPTPPSSRPPPRLLSVILDSQIKSDPPSRAFISTRHQPSPVSSQPPLPLLLFTLPRLARGDPASLGNPCPFVSTRCAGTSLLSPPPWLAMQGLCPASFRRTSSTDSVQSKEKEAEDVKQGEFAYF